MGPRESLDSKHGPFLTFSVSEIPFPCNNWDQSPNGYSNSFLCLLVQWLEESKMFKWQSQCPIQWNYYYMAGGNVSHLGNTFVKPVKYKVVKTEIKTSSQDGEYYNSEKSRVNPLIPKSINSDYGNTIYRSPVQSMYHLVFHGQAFFNHNSGANRSYFWKGKYVLTEKGIILL